MTEIETLVSRELSENKLKALDEASKIYPEKIYEGPNFLVKGGIDPCNRVMITEPIFSDDNSELTYGIYNDPNEPLTTLMHSRINYAANADKIYSKDGSYSRALQSCENYANQTILSDTISQELTEAFYKTADQLNAMINGSFVYPYEGNKDVGYCRVDTALFTHGIIEITYSINDVAYGRLSIDDAEIIYKNAIPNTYLAYVYKGMCDYVRQYLYDKYNNTALEPAAVWYTVQPMMYHAYATLRMLSMPIILSIPYRLKEMMVTVPIKEVRPKASNDSGGRFFNKKYIPQKQK